MRHPTRVADEACSDGERAAADPILGLRGLGKEIRADEDADAYVRRLREGWERGNEVVPGTARGEHG